MSRCNFLTIDNKLFVLPYLKAEENHKYPDNQNYCKNIISVCPGCIPTPRTLFWLLHVLATRNDEVISTVPLYYNVRNRHSNLVLVVELSFLLWKSNFLLNEAVWI